MAYELVQDIIKDLRIRRIFLRLFYDGTPLSNKTSRPFSYFLDDIGVEIFGEIDDVTSVISEKLNSNIKDIHAYLTETQPLPPKVKPNSYIAGDTETQLVSFGRVQPTQVSVFERGVQGVSGKDGAGIDSVSISGGQLIVEIDRPTSVTESIKETVNVGVVKGDSVSASLVGENLVVTQITGAGVTSTISDEKVVGKDGVTGAGVSVGISLAGDGTQILTIISIAPDGTTSTGATAGLSGKDGNDGAVGTTGNTGADSTVAGPRGTTGNTGADSTVAGPRGSTGNTGADSTVAGPTGNTGSGVTGTRTTYSISQEEVNSQGSSSIVLQQHDWNFFFTTEDNDGFTTEIETGGFTAGFTFDLGALDEGEPPCEGICVNGLSYVEGSSSEYSFSTGAALSGSKPTFTMGATGIARLQNLAGPTSDMFFVMSTGRVGDKFQRIEGMSMDTASGQVGFQYGMVVGAGISFHDGSNIQSANDLVTSVNGETGAVDTSGMVIPAFGITVDGGNSADVDVTVAGTVTANRFFDPNNQRSGLVVGAIGTNNVEMHSGLQTVVLYQPQLITANKLLKTATGISMDTAGMTFPDGTHQATGHHGSYTGQIETMIVKEYTLDPSVATARTITGFYIKSTVGAATAVLKVIPSGGGAVTVKSASVTTSSGDQTGLANTSVAVDARIYIDVTAITSPTDVLFAVEYTE